MWGEEAVKVGGPGLGLRHVSPEMPTQEQMLELPELERSGPS